MNILSTKVRNKKGVINKAIESLTDIIDYNKRVFFYVSFEPNEGKLKENFNMEFLKTR